MNIRGLYFPLEATSRSVDIPVVVSATGAMFPVPEAGIFPPTATGFTRLLQASRIRTYDGIDGTRLRRADTFMVYYRYDESIMRNTSLAELDPNICWRGEVIIMKMGRNGQLVRVGSKFNVKTIITEY